MFLDAEASQENFKRPEKAPKRHPKRHPKVVQNLVKKWPKSEPKNEQKKRFPTQKKSPWPVSLGVRLRPWGLLKTLTSKMSKNCSRCIKTVPKWFKNGSRLPKLFKIAPKIPPFLLENIIPGKAVFSPLSFIFWRGITWTPEMWGKGVAGVVPFLD